MATINDVRILLGDLSKWDRQTATGDGVSTRYIVSSLPIITDSEIITVDAVAQTKTTHYTLNPDLGLFTFVTAPGNALAVVAQFAYAELSDESITALIALEPNAYLAAAMGAQSLAGKYASLCDQKVGDLSISYGQRSKAWAELAVKLRTTSRSGTGNMIAPYAGGLSKAEKTTDKENEDLVQPFFRRATSEPEEVTDVVYL